MENTIKIEAIKADNNGFKLISFSRVVYFSKCKPWVSPCCIADFKDGHLRIFNRNDYSTFNFKSFKDALNFIRFKFTDFK